MNYLYNRSVYLRFLFAACATMALLLPVAAGCSCTVEPPSRFEPTADDTAPPAGSPAVAKNAVPGGSLNKFFPKAEGEFSSVFTQEKQGFAMAKLSKDGAEVATFAIMDTVSDASVRDKFKKSEQTYGEYPLATSGKKGTAVLVADRFQVQIRSVDASFTEFDREDWLAKFDLKGLADLK